MNYPATNGHSTDSLTEPNSITSVALPVIKKAKRSSPEKEEKKDNEPTEYFLETEMEEPASAMVDQDTMRESSFPPTQVSPIPTPVLVKNKVFGRYKGQLGNFELEIRIDIDGTMPLQKISGDYYAISGQTKSYFGSFIADSISTSILNGVITITGASTTTWATSFTKLRIDIKQTTIFQPLAPAVLQWFHATTNAPGAMYVCNNFSRAFRTVRLEQDRTSLVPTPFVSYSTGSLPSGGPSRVLTINAAYAEAGVEMINAGISNVVPMALAGPDSKWTNAELHNAMVNHFSLYQNAPAWDAWLFHAYEHIDGPGLYGIMFDQTGFQRQGCAVFYRGIGGTTAQQQRLQAYTCVHELGHCFNLLHSWQKSLATPPKPNIPSSLSWMNYPWGYPGGDVAFWNHFPFQFDPVELTHIRHGLRNDVIMGGNPFTVGSSLQNIAGLFEDNIVNTSNLELELEAKETYLLGEPVSLETKLKTTSTKNNRVISSLHVNYGFVTVGIKKPGGELLVYEPIAEMCIEQEHTVLNKDNPGVYESSYIGFGKQGFVFDQVGTYQLRAVFYHEDGSRIVSDTLKIKVKYPVSQQDNEIADLLLTDEVGYLFAFMGSDAPYLKKGNDALNLVAEKYKQHPLAVYAQFIKGVNEQRTFKTVTPEKNLAVRKPNFSGGQTLLHEVIEKSKTGKGLDNISLNQSMHILAKSYQREGNVKAAESTVKSIVTHFNKQPIKQEVKEMIAKDAATILAPEKEDRQQNADM